MWSGVDYISVCDCYLTLCIAVTASKSQCLNTSTGGIQQTQM